jgi:hypothetical protein
MSNSLLQSNPDALRDSAIAVMTYDRDVISARLVLLGEHDEM